MKVAIDFRDTLIVDVTEQPLLLQLLTSAKTYERKGWGSDCTFTPSDAVPEVVFIKDTQIIADADVVKQLEEELKGRQSQLYSSQNETRTVQKQLAEMQAKFEELENKLVDAMLPPIQEVLQTKGV